MDFRRIGRFPPYVFSIVNELKMQARRAGDDVIDLGMGNPDIPTPEAVVEKLKEAAENSRNHRYSASKGIPKLRQAICDRYQRDWGVDLDPDTEAFATIGADRCRTSCCANARSTGPSPRSPSCPSA